MSEQITISAKNLGALALDDFCPRCFWLKLRLENKLPFQIFPGIFAVIDSYTKKIVHGYVDSYKCFPDWLGGLGALVGYEKPPSFQKFNILDSASNVLLRGSPDAVFVKPNGAYMIADYKTSRYEEDEAKRKKRGDLIPMYEVQLNAYAFIGEQCGLNPVEELALIYFEPETDDDAVGNPVNYRDNGFAMGFIPRVVEVELKPDSIPLLLAEVRRMYDLPKAPKGRDGCKDCLILEKMAEFIP